MLEDPVDAVPPIKRPSEQRRKRPLAWLSQFRRLTVRYERRADIYEGFLLIACSLICLLRIEGRF